MKIMYVINSFGSGGAERHLVALVRHMVRSGNAVLVAALTKQTVGGAKNLRTELEAAGAATRVLDYPGARFFHDIGCWFKLFKLTRAWRPDILHSHLPRSDFAASIVKVFCPEMVWIGTLHDAYVKGVYSGYWVFPFVGWLWRRADALITVSGHVRSWANQVLGVPIDRLHVIYHGVPIGEFPRKTPPPGGQQAVIGCLARYEPRKGMDTLVRAMPRVLERYPEVRLILAGSDPNGYRQVIRDRVSELDLDQHVEVRGFCDNPLGFLSELTIFALPSVAEGFGMVVIEAMSAGCPVVVSDIYPLNHIVLDGITGLTAQAGSPEAFANAFIRLLDDEPLRDSMQTAGHKWCLEAFSEDRALSQVTELYRKIQSDGDMTSSGV
ncbi:MAG TPA: glycosyltransferase family 1 protein [Sedimenticola sp.]|nr:glycosyltransferase family 1 protein [Sedimenticola sp.]